MRTQSSTLETKLILSGLGLADRRMLADLLAFLRDESAWKQILDLFSCWMDKAAETISREEREAVDKLNERLSDTAEEIVASEISDDAMRLLLWIFLRDTYELPAEFTFCHRGASKISVDLGARMAETYFRNIDADWRSGLPGWIRSTLGKPIEQGTFTQMVEDYVLAQLRSLLEESAVRSDKEREVLFDEIWEALSSSPEGAIEAGRGSQADKQALMKALATSGTVGGLALAVETAGFSAYILAAQASAVIPLVGGKTLVSLLAVITNPWVVIPVVVYGINWAKKSSDKSLMTAFGSIAGATLAMNGMKNSANGIDAMLRVFTNAGPLLDELNEIEDQDRICEIVKQYESRLNELKRSVPVQVISRHSEAFERPLVESDIRDGTAALMEGLLREDREPIVLSALTLGDLIYHSAMIHPEVIAAVDYASSNAIGGSFDFAMFYDRLLQSEERSLFGSVERLKGYVAEETVMQRLVEKGHVVEQPDSASQPGYDLIIDGQPVQVKCRDDLTGLEEHFEKYPDIPVIANAELQPELESGAYDWASQVFFLEGFTDEHVTQITTKSLEAGGELVDLDVPVFAASVAAARNVWGCWKGQIAPEEIVWTTATDVAGKGTLSLIGGFATSAVGLLLIGPAGAVIGGPAGGIFGAGGYSRFKSWSGKHINAQVAEGVRESSRQLASVCIEILHEKSQLLQAKRAKLGTGPAGSYARLRFDDELQFSSERICDLERFRADLEGSPQQLRDDLISAVLRSNVHPSRYQAEMSDLLESFEHLEKVLAKTVQKGAGVVWDWITKAGGDIADGARKGWKEGRADYKKGSRNEN